MKTPLFTGCGTAIVTPFGSETVDYAALRSLLDRQLAAGVKAIVVCGTTGEAATMSYGERMRTVDVAVNHVAGRVPVIAGTGANSTETAVVLARDAAMAGVDGLLVVTPFYNKATQQGLVKHYSVIADRVDRPLILYNVPSRTGVSFTADTYARLSQHPNIVGVKEAGGDLALVQKTVDLCPEDFYIWSGNDSETASIMLHGGVGIISVASNVVPEQMVCLADLCLQGRFREAGQLQVQLRELMEALVWEVNPIPVKTAMEKMGLCSGRLRLPLCEMGEGRAAELKRVLEKYELM